MANIALGSAQFGLDYGINNQEGKIPKKEILRILKKSSLHGIEMIDTASAYGDSEEILGDLLSSEELDFRIVTKISDVDKLEIENYVNESISKLKVTTIYGVLFHSFSFIEKDYSRWSSLEDAKRKGLIKKIGISLYHPEEYMQLKEKGIYPDIIQIPFNLFDQRFSDYFHDMKDHNIEIHVRSVFLQGLFFVDIMNLPENFRELKNHLVKIRELSKSNQISIESMCINFVSLFEEVDYMILGVNSYDNLVQNLNCTKDLNKVKSFFESLKQLKNDDENLILPKNWK